MTSTVNAEKLKSDGIYGILGVMCDYSLNLTEEYWELGAWFVFFLSDDIMSSVVVRVDGICCLLSVAIDRSVEPNRNHRVELKAKYSRAVRKD